MPAQSATLRCYNPYGDLLRRLSCALHDFQVTGSSLGCAVILVGYYSTVLHVVAEKDPQRNILDLHPELYASTWHLLSVPRHNVERFAGCMLLCRCTAQTSHHLLNDSVAQRTHYLVKKNYRENNLDRHKQIEDLLSHAAMFMDLGFKSVQKSQFVKSLRNSRRVRRLGSGFCFPGGCDELFPGNSLSDRVHQLCNWIVLYPRTAVAEKSVTVLALLVIGIGLGAAKSMLIHSTVMDYLYDRLNELCQEASSTIARTNSSKRSAADCMKALLTQTQHLQAIIVLITAIDDAIEDIPSLVDALYAKAAPFYPQLMAFVSELLPLYESPKWLQRPNKGTPWAADSIHKSGNLLSLSLLTRRLHMRVPDPSYQIATSPGLSPEKRLAASMLHNCYQDVAGEWESPYGRLVHVLSRLSKAKRCRNPGCVASCAEKGRLFAVCRGCTLTPYCSSACQAQAWAHSAAPHAEVCNSLNRSLVLSGIDARTWERSTDWNSGLQRLIEAAVTEKDTHLINDHWTALQSLEPVDWSAGGRLKLNSSVSGSVDSSSALVWSV